MAITVFNKIELAALAAGRFPVGVNAGSSVQDLLDQLTDERNSADNYAGVMDGGGGTINLTTALSNVDTFDNNVTPANEIFSPDYVNNRIQVFIPCLVDCGIIFQGEWAANVDTTLELWVIDSNNPSPGIKHPAWKDITQTGSGTGRTVDMYKRREIPMGANAPWNFDFENPVYIYLRARADSTITVTQLYIQLSPEYGVYSARDF